MSVLTVFLQTSMAARKRKKFVRSGIVPMKGKCTRRVSRRECPQDCHIMMGWIGMKSKWISIRQQLGSRIRIQIKRVSGTRNRMRRRSLKFKLKFKIITYLKLFWRKRKRRGGNCSRTIWRSKANKITSKSHLPPNYNLNQSWFLYQNRLWRSLKNWILMRLL